MPETIAAMPHRQIMLALGLLLPPVAAGQLVTSPPAGAPDTVHLSRAALVGDVGALTDFIEATHPDPYGREGKLVYHRRLHQLLRAIPAEGLTVAEFHHLLEPFVAAVEDGHTALQPLRTSSGQPVSGPGLPLDLRLMARDSQSVEPALYIQRGPSDEPWLTGSELLSVAGVGVPALTERVRPLDGYENEAGNLQNLVWRLWSEQGLRDLLPEWAPSARIGIRVRTSRGEIEDIILPLGPAPQTWDSTSAGSVVPLPTTRSGVPAWRFVDSTHQVAILRLDNTWAYREGFENLLTVHRGNLNFARQFYQAYYGTAPPADTVTLVRALPQATSVLSELVVAMRKAQTRTLIVDVQRNSGGFSMLVNMLLYYFYGRQGWEQFFGKFFTIRRLTEGDSPAGTFPGRVGDYDFNGEFDAATRSPSEAGSEGYWRSTTLSFGEELTHNTFEGYYAPPQVLVAIGPRTFSGGFWVAAALKRLGARLVGVPSGQAGNAFANVRSFTLPSSGITVGASSRLFVLFPERTDRMPVLPVDVPLTAAWWRALRFDPNAALLLALDSGG